MRRTWTVTLLGVAWLAAMLSFWVTSYRSPGGISYKQEWVNATTPTSVYSLRGGYYYRGLLVVGWLKEVEANATSYREDWELRDEGWTLGYSTALAFLPSSRAMEWNHFSIPRSTLLTGTVMLPKTGAYLIVPFWLLSLLPLPMICWGVRRILLDRAMSRRQRLGLCLHCGYDLRESVDRCPECGRPIGIPA